MKQNRFLYTIVLTSMIIFVGLFGFIFVSAQEKPIPVAITFESIMDLLIEIRDRLNIIQIEVETFVSEAKVSTQEPESTFIFTRKFAYQATGEDVRKLQEFLSQDPDVYPEGLVTGYFGVLTFEAVKRFQEKYAQDILVPISLSRGTGYVGDATIAKLNELYGSAVRISEEVDTAETSAEEEADTGEETEVPTEEEADTGEEEVDTEEEVVAPPPSSGGGASSPSVVDPVESPAPGSVDSSAISDLITSNFTGSAIDLSWLALGDYGDAGVVTSYDVRYSTSSITSGNWSSATPVSGEPTPGITGLNEVFTMSGLSSLTTYYFALKITYESGVESGISNVASGTTIDGIAPGDISDLSASNSTTSSIDLSWTAPGNNGDSGTAASYDIRYSTSSITEGNWSSVTPVSGEPTPQTAGVSESITISNLLSGTTYYFGIKTLDELLNQSGISNVVSSDTSVECSVLSSGKQIYFVNTQNMPQIMQVDLDPEDVAVGATQTVTVLIRDTNENSITLVTGSVLIDNGSDSISFTLIAGDDVNGTWEGTWTPTGIFCTNYVTTITATSASGTSTVDISIR